ncbi:hypothetical protein K3495_g5516 [Podosphaera aphanis]|nr:hypothetical protein K3495_g5516 [Podosphaera aphanis]
MVAHMKLTTDITICDRKPNFTTSREKELSGLIENRVFELVCIKNIPPSTRIFNSRFVDQVKNQGTTKAFEKSRLVVQAYKDLNKNTVLTQAPTIQRASQRIFLCLAAILNLSLYTRDISQAYTQSKTLLTRDFFVRPPAEMSIPKGLVLKVLKPLYGIPEAGTHWVQTYHAHHIENLKMKPSPHDSCLLFTEDDDKAFIGLQTDDSLVACSEKFKAKESVELQKAKFPAKTSERLSESHPIKFIGSTISLSHDGKIILTQALHVGKIQLVDTNKTTSVQQDYIAQRARAAYVAAVCQPQATFSLSFAAQTTNPSKLDVDGLNRCLQWQKDNNTSVTSSTLGRGLVPERDLIEA